LTYALITPRLFTKAQSDGTGHHKGGKVFRHLSGIGRVGLWVFCFLPLLTTALAWVRSYDTTDHIGYRRANEARTVISSEGRVVVGVMDGWIAVIYPSGVSFNAAAAGSRRRLGGARSTD